MRTNDKPSWTQLILFVSGVVLVGLSLGYVNTPGRWYAELVKPPFNPPNWIFAPVWIMLYFMVAIAGWRVWRQSHDNLPMKLWWMQLALNFIWSPVFFSAHRVDIAFGVVTTLLIMIIGFVVVTWRQDKIASLLFTPYALWVAFASILNGSIWLLN